MPLKHYHTNGTVSINLADAFNMQKIADAISSAYPSEPGVAVVGITIPLLSITCKEVGVIDPISDIKNAVSRMYHKFMQGFIQPIWDALYGVYNALKRFGLAVLDLKLPILGLKISDLFNPNIYDVIKKAITNLYESARNKIDAILNILKIPVNIVNDLDSLEKKIEAIVKNIFVSIWDTIIKKIKDVIDLIKIGLRVFDLIVYKHLVWSIVLQSAIDAILKKIMDFFTNPPSIQDIYDALMKFAQRVYNRATGITCNDIMKIISQFRLPIIGLPIDWQLPLNPRVNAPCFDLAQILADMKMWINNFIMKIVQKFVEKILSILSLFGQVFKLPTLHIPITLCVTKAVP
jgi:hypothetical protein